jgi:serine protease AprX
LAFYFFIQMKKITSFIFFFLLFSGFINAQEKFWISFRDKANVCFDPYSYFDERTIQQRLSNHIALNDSTDFPVNPGYLATITEIVESVSKNSRWLNGVAVIATAEQINIISSLPFVKSIEPMTEKFSAAFLENAKPFSLTKKDKALLHFQTQRMQIDSFRVHHIDGTGIRIAIFDVGFPGVDKHPAFAHLREGHKIIETYNFVNKNENVYKGHWHGTATLSCVAGIYDSENIGMATGAEFLLAKTEKLLCESYSEEENWLAAAEWADKHGANIISCSLGYTNKRYFNTEMNGHKSLVARAATLAASKGILVVNAAGNEGSDSWRTVATPADADSVLSVGGTDPYTDLHIFFSSFGPTSDGRLKPNVSALGEAIVATSNNVAREMGTSFAAPFVAGFAACAWQSHRQLTNMELFNEIEQSGNLYPYFDYAHGFGIPQASWFVSPKVEKEPTFDFVIINNDIKVILREKYSYPQEEVGFGYNVQRNFYYKIEDKDGAIKRYTVLLADRKEMLHVFAEDFQTGDVLTVHFEGYTSNLDFPEEEK